MKTEDLTKLGLSDDQVKGVMALNGKDINPLKEQVSSLTGERDGANEQLKQVKGQLTEIQANHKGDKDLQAEIDKLTEANKQAAADNEAKLNAAKLSYKTELALTQAGAKNTKAARAVLNTDDLKLDKDGNVVGLDDQLKALKADDSTKFLFADADPKPEPKQPDTPHITAAGNPDPNVSTTKSLAERVAARLAKN